jgi:hypothetical protein
MRRAPLPALGAEEYSRIPLRGAIAPSLGDACCALCLEKGSAVAIGLRFRRFRGPDGALSTGFSDQADPCKAPPAELQHAPVDEVPRHIQRIRVQRLAVDPNAALRERAASL